MCKVKMLRELMRERLNVATEEIFELFEKTVADYEEKLRRNKEENERRLDELVKAVDELRSLLLQKDAQRQAEAPPEPRDEPAEPLIAQEKDDDDPEDLQSEPESLFAPVSDLEDDTWESSETVRGDEAKDAAETNLDCEGDAAPRDDGEPAGAEKKNCAVLNSSRREKTFHGERSLESHTETHVGEKPFAWTDERYASTHFRKRTREEARDEEPLETTKNSENDKNEFNCTLCPKMFYSKRRLTQHTSTHAHGKPFSCSVCGKRFFWKYTWKRHTEIHARDRGDNADGSLMIKRKSKSRTTGKEHISCSQCGKTFASKNNLTQHKRVHAAQKSHACAVCSKRFLWRGNLLRHEELHKKTKIFTCSICERIFRHRAQLIAHIRAHVNQKPSSPRVTTKADGKSGRGSGSDDVEMECSAAAKEPPKAKNEPTDVQPVSMPSPEEVPFEQKQETGKTLTDGEVPSSSLLKQEDEDVSGCPDEKRLRGQQALEVGVNTLPLTDASFKSEGDEGQSSRSAELFGQGDADGEQCQAFNIAPLSGTDNGVSSDTDTPRILRGDSESDVVRQANVKSLSCSKCDKVFDTSRNMRRHLKMHIHTEELQYGCPMCEKAFRFKCNLKRHLVTHSGVRPHACAVCGNAFTRSHHLKRHMGTHKADKRVFKQPEETAAADRAVRAPDQPLPCLFCTKGFKKKSHLERHMRTHTGEKPFSCGVCNKRFARKERVRNHKCVAHNG